MQTHKHILVIDCCNSFFFFFSFEPLSTVNASLSTLGLYLLSLLFRIFLFLDFSESFFFLCSPFAFAKGAFARATESAVWKSMCVLCDTHPIAHSLFFPFYLSVLICIFDTLCSGEPNLFCGKICGILLNITFFFLELMLVFFFLLFQNKACFALSCLLFFLSFSLLPFAFCLLPFRCLTSWQWR